MYKVSIRKRNEGLDALKFICAFLVICIHEPFPGIFGEYVTALSRIAVPIFFMISGYFYSEIVKDGKCKKWIVKIFKLFVGASIFYFLFNNMFNNASGGGILTHKQSMKL